MGKAKPAKHTAAEIKSKVAAATTNKGGGNAGKEDRLGGKAGHAKYKCNVCAQQVPDMKTMQVRPPCPLVSETVFLQANQPVMLGKHLCGLDKNWHAIAVAMLLLRPGLRHVWMHSMLAALQICELGTAAICWYAPVKWVQLSCMPLYLCAQSWLSACGINDGTAGA
jgi:hypothetical protein